MVLNLDKEVVEKVQEKLKENNGYCPCMIVKNENTICPCLPCRTKNVCICGLYIDEREEV